jgi:hypothetical protein
LNYKLYFLDREDGHIDRVLDLDSADDERAVRAAVPLADGHPMELWQRSRKVQRFGTLWNQAGGAS